MGELGAEEEYDGQEDGRDNFGSEDDDPDAENVDAGGKTDNHRDALKRAKTTGVEKANSGTSGEAEITEKLNAPSGATGDAAETAGPVPMLTESDLMSRPAPNLVPGKNVAAPLLVMMKAHRHSALVVRLYDALKFEYKDNGD